MNLAKEGPLFALCAALMGTNACNAVAHRQGKQASHSEDPATKSATNDLPSFATVVVDFSASFAPLTQTDRLALIQTAHALADLATQEWSPPTTIVWRKIGSTSTTASPLCDVIEYNRSIIGALTAAENLRDQLGTCTEAVVRASRAQGAQETNTDIADGVMMAAQSWEAMPGRKALIILSDFLEDLPRGGHAAPIQLHGESVLMLDRPGTTEKSDPAAYLDRIAAWKNRLAASGAKSVATLPTFRATLSTIEQALTQAPGTGTSISLVSDLHSPTADQRTLNRAVTTISAAIAKRATEWPAPVTAGWFVAGRPAWRTTAIAPIVYTPRLARRANEMNTIQAFERAIEEMGLALEQRHEMGNGDIGGSLRLIGGSETTTTRYLVILSDFATQAPTPTNPSLQGERVLMAYRTRAATDGQSFFDGLNKWQQYFRAMGAAHVCALDIATLTDSSISTCLEP